MTSKLQPQSRYTKPPRHAVIICAMTTIAPLLDTSLLEIQKVDFGSQICTDLDEFSRDRKGIPSVEKSSVKMRARSTRFYASKRSERYTVTVAHRSHLTIRACQLPTRDGTFSHAVRTDARSENAQPLLLDRPIDYK